MSASTPKGYLQYWDQTDSLNQPEIAVFLACSGGETGHQISSLLPGNPMETGSPTSTTTTSHWAFRMATWFTISVLPLILGVHLTSVLMVCYIPSSTKQSS